jgi:hypothetical protein
MASQVEYTKLTDVYFAFLNFDASTGNLDLTNQVQLNTVITAAKANNPNIRIHISTGGGGFDVANFNTMVGNAVARANFVSSMANYIQSKNLDGWNLDWEYPWSQAEMNNHELLLKDMSTAIKAKQTTMCKQLDVTIAVDGVSYGDYLNLNAVNYVDYLLVMSYDAPSFLYANHSTYAMAQNALDGWNTWGVPYAKMILAVPFYGWDSSRGTAQTYSQIAAPAPSTVYNSTTDLYGGQYYNSAPTLRNKIDLIMRAGKKGAGMAVWELGQDRAGLTYSLLDAIYQKFLSSYAISGLPANPCSLPLVFQQVVLSKVEGEYVKISWVTSDERNVKKYLVQRSDDGNEFLTVAEINPQSYNLTNDYYVLDPIESITDVIYYRIIEVDNDLSKMVSDIQSIDLNSDFKIEISPNPTEGEIFVKGCQYEQLVLVEVMNGQGVKVFSKELNNESGIYKLDINGLSTGFYLLNFHLSSQNYCTKIQIK